VHNLDMELQGHLKIGSEMKSAKRRIAKRYLVLSCDPKRLWRNIFSFGSMNESSNNVGCSRVADALNTYCTTPSTGTGSPYTSHISYRLLMQDDSFKFFCVDEMGHR
jgi:hypothetical protein